MLKFIAMINLRKLFHNHIENVVQSPIRTVCVFSSRWIFSPSPVYLAANEAP